MFSVGKLGTIAVCGAFGVIGMGMLERTVSRGNLLKLEPVVKSMDILHDYTYSQSLFGKPLLPEFVNVDHEFYEYKNEKLTLPIQFRGEKGSGVLYSYCTSMVDDDKNIVGWRVDRLDLEVSNSRKKWTFYLNPRAKEETSQSNVSKDSKTQEETLQNKGSQETKIQEETLQTTVSKDTKTEVKSG